MLLTLASRMVDDSMLGGVLGVELSTEKNWGWCVEDLDFGSGLGHLLETRLSIFRYLTLSDGQSDTLGLDLYGGYRIIIT